MIHRKVNDHLDPKMGPGVFKPKRQLLWQGIERQSVDVRENLSTSSLKYAFVFALPVYLSTAALSQQHFQSVVVLIHELAALFLSNFTPVTPLSKEREVCTLPTHLPWSNSYSCWNQRDVARRERISSAQCQHIQLCSYLIALSPIGPNCSKPSTLHLLPMETDGGD
jgi:hypothetical protein